MNTSLVVAIFIIINVVLSGCASSYYSPVAEPFVSNVESEKNDNINFQDKLQRMVDKQFSKEVKVLVYSNHFNVLVVGQVKNKQTEYQLVDFLKKQENVVSVWDYTSISSTMELNYSASQTQQSLYRLSQEQDIDSDKITVVAVDNIVYIMGTNVGDLTHLERAIKGIYTIGKVKQVINLVKMGNDDYYSVK